MSTVSCSSVKLVFMTRGCQQEDIIRIIRLWSKVVGYDPKKSRRAEQRGKTYLSMYIYIIIYWHMSWICGIYCFLPCYYMHPLNRPAVGHNIHKIKCMPFKLNLAWAKETQNYVWTSGNFMSQIWVSACFTHLSCQTHLYIYDSIRDTHPFWCPYSGRKLPMDPGWQDPTSTTNWNTRCISCGRTPQVAMCCTGRNACSSAFFVGFEKGFFYMLKN